MSCSVGRRRGFGSRIAVVVVEAGSCRSDSSPSLGTSICRRCGPKKEKKKRGGIPAVVQQVAGCIPGRAHWVKEQAWPQLWLGPQGHMSGHVAESAACLSASLPLAAWRRQATNGSEAASGEALSSQGGA